MLLMPSIMIERATRVLGWALVRVWFSANPGSRRLWRRAQPKQSWLALMNLLATYHGCITLCRSRVMTWMHHFFIKTIWARCSLRQMVMLVVQSKPSTSRWSIFLSKIRLTTARHQHQTKARSGILSLTRKCHGHPSRLQRHWLIQQCANLLASVDATLIQGSVSIKGVCWRTNKQSHPGQGQTNEVSPTESVGVCSERGHID